MLFYSLFLIASDSEDYSYINYKMSRKNGAGSNNTDNIDIGNSLKKNCDRFKYLGVTISANGKSDHNVINKIGQGRWAIIQLNLIL